MNEFKKAEALSQEVLYQDETGFSKVSIGKKTYSPFRTNIEINQNELMQPNITAVATVSSKKGLVYLSIQEEGVNESNFQVYIKTLSKKMDSKPFFLYMDNLSVHRMIVVRNLYRQLGITPVYNISYSPDLNPIEHIWAQLKAIGRKLRSDVDT